MTIDEFLAGMAEHHPMIQRRALDVHFLNGGQLEAHVKYIKWSSDGCEVHLRQYRPKIGKYIVTLTVKQLKMSDSEWGLNLESSRKARADAAARKEEQHHLRELAYAQAEVDRANKHLAKLQLELEEHEHYIRTLRTTNNPQGGGN